MTTLAKGIEDHEGIARVGACAEAPRDGNLEALKKARERERYKAICQEMKSILQLEKEVAANKAKIRKEILEISQGERMEYGIKISWRVYKGSIDYKKLVDDYDISEEVKETYRKSNREYFEVRSY